jgi:hypothetical protein
LDRDGIGAALEQLWWGVVLLEVDEHSVTLARKKRRRNLDREG